MSLPSVSQAPTGKKKQGQNRKEDDDDYEDGSSTATNEALFQSDNAVRKGSLKCVRKGTIDLDSKKHEWLKRAPFFLIIGAQKAGTSSMFKYLKQHPQIIRPRRKELHFFDKKFDPFLIEDKDGSPAIDADAALEAYLQFFSDRGKDERLREDKSRISFEGSPIYIFGPPDIATRILCVVPWVKLIVMLRNPIDRAYSHYTMMSEKFHKEQGDFDEVVQQDLKRMEKAGLIHDWSKMNFDEYHGSQQESEAFARYRNQLSGDNSYLGRGLYSVELREWEKALEKINKPKSDMMIVQFEKAYDTDESILTTVHQITSFLGLPPHTPYNLEPLLKGKYKKDMTEDTRELLGRFFEPYNRALADMLGPQWEDVWKTD